MAKRSLSALRLRAVFFLAGVQHVLGIPGMEDEGTSLGGRWQDRWALSGRAQCNGVPRQNETYPLDRCSFISASGTSFSLRFRCNATTLTVEVFGSKDTGCERPLSASPVPLGVCLPGSRGASELATCNATVVSIAQFSSAPDAPTNVSCGSGAGVRTSAGGSDAEGLPVECVVNASLADQVSFEVGLPSGRPFISFTAAADANGKVRAVVPGLLPGTQYRVVARSHRRGTNEGNPDTWSAKSGDSALCTTPAAVFAERPQGRALEPDKQKGPATRWIEVFRVASGTDSPDFLDQHNAGDLAAELASASIMGRPGAPFPLSRYCVEVLDVTLPNITTASTSGESQSAPFADYASCNAGDCRCMHQVDRTLARLPAEQIRELCSGPPADNTMNSCRCSPLSDEQSQRYVGRCPVPLPFHVDFTLEARPLTIPADYPPSFHSWPMGHYYSFPSEGRCPLGASPGQGNCTWQRAPLVHTLYNDDLFRRGMTRNGVHVKINRTTGALMAEDVDYLPALYNIALGKRLFAKLGVPPCGATPPAALSEGASGEGSHDQKLEVVLV